MPRGLPDAEIAALPEGDAARGETCSGSAAATSCHAPARARRATTGACARRRPDARDRLRRRSSCRTSRRDPEDGIGGWSAGDFANAMLRGVSPDGRHYYPAFPYTSYARMKTERRRRSLGLSADPARGGGARTGPRVSRFPFSVPPRDRAVEAGVPGRGPSSTLDTRRSARRCAGATSSRGRGIAANAIRRATSRARSMTARWLGGAPIAGGRRADPQHHRRRGRHRRTGRRPTSPITSRPASRRTSTPSAGSMVEVQAQSRRCWRRSDREAIAAYLKAVPPVAQTGG